MRIKIDELSRLYEDIFMRVVRDLIVLWSAAERMEAVEGDV